VLEKKSDREDKALETVSVFIGIDGVQSTTGSLRRAKMGSRESFCQRLGYLNIVPADQELSELAGVLKVMKKMCLAT
jgi:hypothetical protein